MEDGAKRRMAAREIREADGPRASAAGTPEGFCRGICPASRESSKSIQSTFDCSFEVIIAVGDFVVPVPFLVPNCPKKPSTFIRLRPEGSS
jgi:hypothetical protein